VTRQAVPRRSRSGRPRRRSTTWRTRSPACHALPPRAPALGERWTQALSTPPASAQLPHVPDCLTVTCHLERRTGLDGRAEALLRRVCQCAAPFRRWAAVAVLWLHASVRVQHARSRQ
jgi:hypothetical protein